jgi:hypothetical protein
LRQADRAAALDLWHAMLSEVRAGLLSEIEALADRKDNWRE